MRSTLKITSAMKLVASSKLRRAQRSIEALRPYEQTLTEILEAVEGFTTPDILPKTSASLHPSHASVGPSRSSGHGRPLSSEEYPASVTPAAPIIILAVSSNSSMCGAFNANVLKKALELGVSYGKHAEFWAFGRKMAEGLRKSGFAPVRDYSAMMGRPEFAPSAEIAAELRESLASGTIGGAILVYNHFVSTGRQEVVVEQYLSASSEQVQEDFAPSELIPPTADAAGPSHSRLRGRRRSPEPYSDEADAEDGDELYILEPSRGELMASLMPQVLDLRLYAALLDSSAAEHAARMVAMQAASDNAESLLGDLTLEYNKGRQQKITSEILDLVAGGAD